MTDLRAGATSSLSVSRSGWSNTSLQAMASAVLAFCAVTERTTLESASVLERSRAACNVDTSPMSSCDGHEA